MDGNYAITAIMGLIAIVLLILTLVNPASTLRGSIGRGVKFPSIYNFLSDSAESLTADVWNLLYISDKFQNQKLLQFKITNNSGGSSDVETAFMRLV